MAVALQPPGELHCLSIRLTLAHVAPAICRTWRMLTAATVCHAQVSAAARTAACRRPRELLRARPSIELAFPSARKAYLLAVHSCGRSHS